MDQCPLVNEWIDKMWYVHIMIYYSAFKMKKIVLCATIWMNLKDIKQSEISQ